MFRKYIRKERRQNPVQLELLIGEKFGGKAKRKLKANRVPIEIVSQIL